MIAALRPISDLWREQYLRWALSEIDPLHPDLPLLMVSLSHVERRVSGSRAALRIKTVLATLGRTVRRASLAFWRWA